MATFPFNNDHFHRAVHGRPNGKIDRIRFSTHELTERIPIIMIGLTRRILHDDQPVIDRDRKSPGNQRFTHSATFPSIG